MTPLCRRLKPAQDSYIELTQGSPTPTTANAAVVGDPGHALG